MSFPPHYLDRVEREIKRNKALDISGNEIHTFKQAVLNASLYHLNPGFSIHQLHTEKLYREILFHQQLSLADMNFPELTDKVSLKGFHQESKDLLQSTPCIICTFHTGSYRLINHLLHQWNIPYSLVVASEVMKLEQDLYKDLLKTHHPDKNNFGIINAEARTSGIQIIRAIKEGRSILLYVDGSTGIKNDKEKLVEIPFLNGQIYARSGAGFLSYHFQLPAINVACYRDDAMGLHMLFHQPQIPLPEMPEAMAILNITKFIFSHLEEIVRRYPTQWEGWLYIYRSIYLKSLPDQSIIPVTNHSMPVVFNHRRFSLMTVRNTPLIFHYESFQVQLTTKTLFEQLKSGDFAAIDKDMFSCLAKKGIIIAGKPDNRHQKPVSYEKNVGPHNSPTMG